MVIKDMLKKVCKFCGCEYDENVVSDSSRKPITDICDNCKCINDINNFVANYNNKHRAKVWSNEIIEKNFIKDIRNTESNFSSYTLGIHKTSYRVEKRTKRVQTIIDKISYIREYLYFNLNPIFEILDSIYIKKDIFWDDSGNLIKYVHDCCFQEAVLKLRELLIDGSCKYSIKRISNTLCSDSKYVFNDQKIFERFEFDMSRESFEERYEPFNIDSFITLVNKTLEDNKCILEAMKDYRDNQFAHIDNLKNEISPIFFHMLI